MKKKKVTTETEMINDVEAAVESKKGIGSKIPIIVMIFTLVVAGILITAKLSMNRENNKVTVNVLKPGPIVKWDMDMNNTLSDLALNLVALNKVTGDAKVQLCTAIGKDITSFATGVAPAPDQVIQDLFATWISSASRAMDSCSKNLPSAKADMTTSEDNFKLYLAQLNLARVGNR
jgi:hypothetical protein